MSTVELSPDLEDTQPVRVVSIPPRRIFSAPRRDGWASEPASPEDEAVDVIAGLRAKEPSTA